KANMHTFQLSAEDYGVQNDGTYADLASSVASLLPSAGANFKNPFDQTVGSGNSWVDLGSTLTANPGPAGMVSYADSSQNTYAIRGFGKTAPLTLVLSAGQ
ncbi:MAG: hypothetical protein ACHQ52_09355, partial [Candidatus Eisenbacteria bacterium]